MPNREEIIKTFVVPPDKKISLKKDYDPAYKADYVTKEDAAGMLQEGIEQLKLYQDMLYAQDTYALLIVFQAMDAAGKDGTIKHVMSGVNPQGCQVYSFKAPSSEELDHDYLWRCAKNVPERGRIGIFNRSYYEEVLITRVHPEVLAKQKLPTSIMDKHLNVSKNEQKKRFLERIDRPEKNWKFSASDAKERAFWDDYMEAYEDMFNNTSTAHAPWYIIPADRKWFTRLAVAAVIDEKLKSLNLQYPTISEETKIQLMQAKQILENE